MQIEGLKVTDYIKTDGADTTGFGVGTSGIRDDKKANSNTVLKSISVDNAFYDNKGKLADEDFAKELNEVSALGMSTVEAVKNVERAWDDEATAKATEDGHNPMDMDSHTLITVVDEIKMNLAKAGADISKMGGLSSTEIEAMSGSISQAIEMTRGLSDYLPEETQAYLVKNELEPTITNIYNATYSAPINPEDGKSSAEIQQLLQDLGNTIDSLIREIEGEQNQSAQRTEPQIDLKEIVATMLKQDVPITKEHLEYMVGLQQYEKPTDQQLEAAIEDIVAEGKEPTDAYLLPGYSLMDQAKKTFEEVMGMDVNDLQSVTAQRQLVEIQLTMTVEATFTMMKNGIEVNTNDLSDLLDKLKLQETNLLQILMKADSKEATNSNVNLFKQVMNEMAEISQAPAATLGRFSNINAETFSYVHEVSVSVTAEYSRMEMTYEAVGTEVRRDLGDNINKAFQNVDDILADLNIPATESSQKAVRILAYNQMDITAESVMNVKASSEMVTRTFKSMTPAVVAEMIKRDENPLDMTIGDLKQKAEAIKAELGSESDSESFAKFLWKAEHNSQITDSERDAYIGVYRLLHQVEKSDGAAIGALISQGAEITLRNLMTSVRSSKHTGKEYEIDDNFGELDEMVVKDLSITEQIEKVFLTDRCRDAREAMTPAKMHLLGEDNILAMNPDEFASAMEQSLDDSAEVQYNHYLTEQLKNGLANADKVDNILEQFNIPSSANMITAVENLLSNPGGFAKDLYGRSAKLQNQEMDINDLIDLAYSRFEEACHSPEAMKEAEEALGDLAETIMKSMINMEDVRTVDLDNMKLVVQQSKAIQQMAATGETYHIPVTMDGEVGDMNLRIVRDDMNAGVVKMAIYLQETATIQTTFHYEAGEVTANVECDTADRRDALASLADHLSEQMQAETGFSFSFSFTKANGITASDIYNMQQGLLATTDASLEKDEIQTEALYGIARSYMKLIGELF